MARVRHMDNKFPSALGIPAVLFWILGVVLASIKGGTAMSLCVAVVFPPWAWYLSVEYLSKHLGLL
jgi:hypothetical protein